MTRHFAVSMGAIALFAGTSLAVVHTLEDRNSFVNIDDASSSGMFNWVVDGTDHMFQQSFWYRIGAVAESPISSLPFIASHLSDTNFFTDPRPDTLALRYEDPILRVLPTWQLRGGLPGSGRADVAESIQIDNLTNQGFTISFFQYCDFDLNASPGGDTVEIPGALHNTARQSEGAFVMSETVVSPQPTHYEVAAFPSILTRLGDAFPDDLLDIAGPLGPGDVTWAFQWDLFIPAGGTVIISKDKNIIPAPGALALLGLSGLAAVRRRR